MARLLYRWTTVGCLCAVLLPSATAQSSARSHPANATASAQQGIRLAAKGRCREALKYLKKSTLQIADKELKYRGEMAVARCAMSLEDTGTAVEALLALKREFPEDPEVLYTATHFFSELASRSSEELAKAAPSSPEARQLEAEALESQGKWDDATTLYKKILEANPQAPGIHYRLGRILLAKTPPDNDAANKEFEEELKHNPDNAAAEFMLGESARQSGQWDTAIARFSKACQLDEGFAEAYLALGMSLNSAGRFSDAISPLERYVKLETGDPAGHYQLATAYARTGRKQEAAREIKLQQEATANSSRRPPER